MKAYVFFVLATFAFPAEGSSKEKGRQPDDTSFARTANTEYTQSCTSSGFQSNGGKVDEGPRRGSKNGKDGQNVRFAPCEDSGQGSGNTRINADHYYVQNRTYVPDESGDLGLDGPSASDGVFQPIPPLYEVEQECPSNEAHIEGEPDGQQGHNQNTSENQRTKSTNRVLIIGSLITVIIIVILVVFHTWD